MISKSACFSFMILLDYEKYLSEGLKNYLIVFIIIKE
jgi:hypothetical protein